MKTENNKKHIGLGVLASFIPTKKIEEENNKDLKKGGEGERWITVNGKHIKIDGEGKIVMGNIGQNKSHGSEGNFNTEHGKNKDEISNLKKQAADNDKLNSVSNKHINADKIAEKLLSIDSKQYKELADRIKNSKGGDSHNYDIQEAKSILGGGKLFSTKSNSANPYQGKKDDKNNNSLEEGSKVQASKNYGGKAGTIKSFDSDKKFATVKHEDGSEGSYHVSDLSLKEDEEDDEKVGVEKNNWNQAQADAYAAGADDDEIAALADKKDNNISDEVKLKKLHDEIEKHYGRKLESSQINTMMGDNKISKKIEEYRNLSRNKK
jgi:hypothetical protein